MTSGGVNFLTSHLVKLPKSTRERILESEFSCQALLSSLTPLAKQYALRLTFSLCASESLVNTWPADTKVAKAKHKRAIKELVDLGIWTKKSSKRQEKNGVVVVREASGTSSSSAAAAAAAGGGGRSSSSSSTSSYHLQKSFAQKIQLIMESGFKSLWSEPSEKLRLVLPSKDRLRQHAQTCWDSLLLFLSGREEIAEKLVDDQAASLPIDLDFGSSPLELEDVFTRLGLMERATEDKMDGDEVMMDASSIQVPLETTPKGFQFLLKPPAEQIWTILDEFLQMQYDLKGEEGAAAVSFLLQLGFCEEGRTCPLSEFGKWETKATCALSQLGLLYPFKDKESGQYWILPTHLSKLLCHGDQGTLDNLYGNRLDSSPSSSSSAALGISTEEGIVVETNYRVYAYTSSPLKRFVLELFCQQEYILPNLFVGRLTRDSCVGAFEAGVDSESIIDFLRRNVHPQAARLRSKIPTVPETVADGIRLWEAESQRMDIAPAAFYDNFDSTRLFELSIEHARENNVCLWADEGKQRLAVQLGYYNQMRAFIKETKIKLSSA